MIAMPTVVTVSECPIPHHRPVSSAGRSPRCRETIVVTATTWSASVACRMPSTKPSVTTSSAPLTIHASCHSA
jgi:hypothetical protein